MRPLSLFLACVTAALLAGCASTPESRIADDHTDFDKFPTEVQQKIRAGQVDVGFTPAMVRLALGEPDRVFSRQTAAGESEVWGYHDHGPRFSFGVGVGGAIGRHSSAGVGVATSGGGYDPEERMRVEFRNGQVAAVEYVRR